MSMMDKIQEKAAGVFGTTNAPLTQAVSRIIEACGGVDGLIKKFQDKGHGDIVQSWIARTPNKAITADQINSVIGPSLIQSVAAKVGMTPESLSQQLATYLPLLIDKLTPDGELPRENWWARTMDKARDFFGASRPKH